MEALQSHPPVNQLYKEESPSVVVSVLIELEDFTIDLDSERLLDFVNIILNLVDELDHACGIAFFI